MLLFCSFVYAIFIAVRFFVIFITCVELIYVRSTTFFFFFVLVLLFLSFIRQTDVHLYRCTVGLLKCERKRKNIQWENIRLCNQSLKMIWIKKICWWLIISFYNLLIFITYTKDWILNEKHEYIKKEIIAMHDDYHHKKW
jgi:hypothetical protein